MIQLMDLFCMGRWRATIWNSIKSNQTQPKVCSNKFIDLHYDGE